jgi:vacuolar protein sorting-associated protein 1
MSIVTERINAAKPPPPPADPKSGRLAPGQINNSKDLDVELPKEDPGFFGTFFSGNKGAKKRVALTNGRPGSPVRSSSSWGFAFRNDRLIVDDLLQSTPSPVMSAMEQPPPVIRPQMALNEREQMETEVISALYSTSLFALMHSQFLIRTPHTFVFQHYQTRDD